MRKRVLALGLDPAGVDLSAFPDLSPQLVRSFIDAQFTRLRDLGYDVVECLVDPDSRAETVTTQQLQQGPFDCVLFGAGLRAPDQLRLFEKLLNLVHIQAPAAKICLNHDVADTVAAVQRWT